jgi:hypothetical protein
MSSDDRAAAAIHRLEKVLDAANDLIGDLIRRLEDHRPRLRVVGGDLEETASPGGESTPVLHVLDPHADG